MLGRNDATEVMSLASLEPSEYGIELETVAGVTESCFWHDKLKLVFKTDAKAT